VKKHTKQNKINSLNTETNQQESAESKIASTKGEKLQKNNTAVGKHN
jgi:hypothetical protein